MEKEKGRKGSMKESERQQRESERSKGEGKPTHATLETQKLMRKVDEDAGLPVQPIFIPHSLFFSLYCPYFLLFLPFSLAHLFSPILSISSHPTRVVITNKLNCFTRCLRPKKKQRNCNLLLATKNQSTPCPCLPLYLSFTITCNPHFIINLSIQQTRT